MTDIRQRGVNSILSVLNDKKMATKIEKALYKKMIDNHSDEDYLTAIYQIVGMLVEKQDLKVIDSMIKDNKFLWNNPCYEKIAVALEEHDDYILSPFDVVDGVVQCPKCKNNKTWSVQKQVRSCDEPMTTFSICVTCGHKWRYSG
jgi:DNA-directed RNA polymerase subunit M/transcription elongation factor TFIIS